MQPKWSGYPAFNNHPVWTQPYYGVQYRKNVSRRIHISVTAFDSGGAIAKLIDLDLYKHLSQSNFTATKEEYFSTVEEARYEAERW